MPERHNRTHEKLLYWRANPHPFIPRRGRPKDCSRCDLGKTNPIHIESDAMTEIPIVDLEQARDLGAATYMSAFVHLMCREFGVDDSNKESINHMVMQMVEPLNIATEAIFRALMGDQKWVPVEHRFEDALAKLAKGATHDTPLFPEPKMDFDI